MLWRTSGARSAEPPRESTRRQITAHTAPPCRRAVFPDGHRRERVILLRLRDEVAQRLQRRRPVRDVRGLHSASVVGRHIVHIKRNDRIDRKDERRQSLAHAVGLVADRIRRLPCRSGCDCGRSLALLPKCRIEHSGCIIGCARSARGAGHLLHDTSARVDRQREGIAIEGLRPRFPGRCQSPPDARSKSRCQSSIALRGPMRPSIRAWKISPWRAFTCRMFSSS